MSAPVASADSPRLPAAARSSARQDEPPRQQLYVAGGLSAAMAAMIGLATLATLALIGWVGAPHGAFGEDIPDVLRMAVQMWLVGHHVGFAVPGGHIALLPMGLLLVPGLVLYRSGRRLARNCDIPRVRGVFRAALAIAGPYSAITGTLAIVAQTQDVQPSMVQALVAGFALAYVAGGLGVLRQLLVDKKIARRRLLYQLPPRLRSLVVATFTATVILMLAGLLLFVVGLVTSFGAAVEITQQLRPGIVGGVLLILLQVLYLPNAVIFGTSYAAGPGFSVGVDTVIAPTGISHGPLPALPMLAALPDNGPAPLLSLAALLAPFIAGAVAGWQTIRTRPTPVSEAAPIWGFVCGASTGVVWGVLATIAGGALGGERLAVLGPSGWQVGAIIALEVGLAAAIAGWLANWLHFRRAIRTGEVAMAEDEGETVATRAGRAAADRAATTVASARLRMKARKQRARSAPTPQSESSAPPAPKKAKKTRKPTTTATKSTPAPPPEAAEPSAPDADEPTRDRAARAWLRRPGTAAPRPAATSEEESDDNDVQFGVVYEEGADDPAVGRPQPQRPAANTAKVTALPDRAAKRDTASNRAPDTPHDTPHDRAGDRAGNTAPERARGRARG